MIAVNVRVFATLRRYLPGKAIGEPISVEIEEGCTILNLMKHLGIPPEETKQSFVNGLQQDPDYVLKEGDEVGIFPPVAGG